MGKGGGLSDIALIASRFAMSEVCAAYVYSELIDRIHSTMPMIAKPARFVEIVRAGSVGPQDNSM